MHVRALTLGFVVDLLLFVAVVTLALPAWLVWPAVFATLCGGLVSGYAAGTFVDGDWRARARIGAIVGAVGGVALGSALYAAMNVVFVSTRHSALWGLQYAVATSGVPPDLAAAYGHGLSVALAGLLAVLFTVEGAVAAASVPSPQSVPTA